MDNISNLVHNVKYTKPNKEKEIFLYEGDYNNFSFEKHIHEEYTITLIERGNMGAFLRGFNHKFDKSSIITINPDEVHSCGILSKEGFKHHSLYISTDIMNNILKENFNNNLLSFKNFQFSNEIIYQKLHPLMNYNSSLFSKLSWECELIDAINSILKINTKVSNEIILPNNYKLIQYAKEFINDNYNQNFTLDDFAKEFHISKYHFLRLFKKHTFVSPHTYLMIRRVEKAKQFLRNNTNISEIAYLCGFTDQSHLNKKFKLLTGTTPGEYKNFFL
ncbi:helix-turn-helix domain-containing protein [Arcobacter sp. F2176]|uniref:AraC family transcriptional regulator n=1 Tax=Arcobacter sp. F2176 TaxID=2044511 RepID=UPI00100A4526|nr:helix-turn-helix domain-containing protein [Arcobacter sp. F2176]RXJ80900.1 AraC family transcriptional regulator [Arcobacter sp. F2176]